MEIDFALVLARWVHFVSLMLVFGTSLFPLYALPRAIGGMAQPPLAKAQRWARPLSVVALVSGVAWLALSIMLMADGPASLMDWRVLAAFFSQTEFGPVWLMRLLLLIVLAVLVRLRWAMHNPLAHHLSCCCVAGGSLTSMAWLGHAAMATGTELGAQLASYMAHVLAAGAWIGGLLPLGYVIASQIRRQDSGACGLILARFSNVGLVAVSIILASGIANTVFRLSSPADLVRTPYGLTILAKLALFTVMLGIAAFNRWRLMPRMAAASLAAAKALRRDVIIEQALGLAVLAAAALLGTLPP